MSQTKYELMVIIDPSVDERTVAPTLDKFLAVVPKEGGTIENIDIWGRRKFAYPIKKQTEGTYAVIKIESESATIQELDRLLNISEDILRTKVLRAEEAVVDLRKASDKDKADAPQADAKPEVKVDAKPEAKADAKAGA